jgi:hypothetical protein
LVVNFSLYDRKARWIMNQAFEPLWLALGQQPPRLLRHGCWQWYRRSVGTLTLSPILAPIPSHLFFGLQKYFHDGLHPSWWLSLLFLLHALGHFSQGTWMCHRSLGTGPLHSAIAYITPADKLAGRAEAIWATRREKLAEADARRRAKTKEKAFAPSPSPELHWESLGGG